MGICLTLEEVDYLYNKYFSQPRPAFVNRTKAIQILVNDVGVKKLNQTLERRKVSDETLQNQSGN